MYNIIFYEYYFNKPLHSKSILFYSEINNLIQQGHNTLIVNTFIMLQKISISNKCCSSELFISSKNPEKNVSPFPQTY